MLRILISIGFVACFVFLTPLENLAQEKLSVDRNESLTNPLMYYFFLNQPEVRSELELVGSQLDGINKAMDSLRARQDKYMRDSMKFRSDPISHGKLRNAFMTAASTDADNIKSELLPHQMKRLEQVALQFELREYNKSSVFIAPRMINELTISDSQKDKIKSFAKERNTKIEDEFKRFQKRIREIQENTQNEILGVLDKQQQKKAKSLLGPPTNILPLNSIRNVSANQNRSPK